MDVIYQSKLNVVWTGMQKLTAGIHTLHLGNGRVLVRMVKN